MARVVITGGAGFLGSHLADELLGRGDEVVAIDNLSTGNNANIEHLFALPGFTFVEHDVSNYVWVPGDVDAVLHFASPASPSDYLKMPIQTLKVGSLGTHTFKNNFGKVSGGAHSRATLKKHPKGRLARLASLGSLGAHTFSGRLATSLDSRL